MAREFETADGFLQYATTHEGREAAEVRALAESVGTYNFVDAYRMLHDYAFADAVEYLRDVADVTARIGYAPPFPLQDTFRRAFLLADDFINGRVDTKSLYLLRGAMEEAFPRIRKAAEAYEAAAQGMLRRNAAPSIFDNLEITNGVAAWMAVRTNSDGCVRLSSFARRYLLALIGDNMEKYHPYRLPLALRGPGG